MYYVELKIRATAFNGQKKQKLAGKARLNNEITSLLFLKLMSKELSHILLKQLSDTEQLVKKVTIIPLEVVIRNVSCR